MVTEPGWYRLTGHGWERVTDEDARAEMDPGGGWDLLTGGDHEETRTMPRWLILLIAVLVILVIVILLVEHVSIGIH